MREPFDVLCGLVLLLVSDGVLRVRGFPALHRLVRRWPTLRRREGRAAVAFTICRGVDRAAMLYFKHPWCLQRSAASVLLLRLHGIPATLVLGAHRMPFAAHAWVELDGEVLNDDAALIRARYMVLETC